MQILPKWAAKILYALLLIWTVDAMQSISYTISLNKKIRIILTLGENVSANMISQSKVSSSSVSECPVPWLTSQFLPNLKIKLRYLEHYSLYYQKHNTSNVCI